MSVLEICEFPVHLTKCIPQLAHTFRGKSQKQGKYREDGPLNLSITPTQSLSDKNTRKIPGRKEKSLESDSFCP